MTDSAQTLEHSPDAAPRTGRTLIDATRPFAKESTARSWWHTLETLGLLAASVTATVLVQELWARALLSVLSGLLVVRGFILYHDVMHSAMLRGSKLGKAVYSLYGLLVLTPPNIWKHTHNYHHAHTAKMVGSHIGSYPTVTVAMYKALTPQQRFMYRAARHPLTILLGYFTIFLWGMCVSSFRKNPKKYWDSLAALVLHAALVALVLWLADVEVLLFAYLLPLAIACCLGGYLFYAQHNFEGMHIQPRHEWSFDRAALESSSYMALNPVLDWFTGRIGYHHVHHLNPTIPFYRLAETMRAVPELQHPGTTDLTPGEVWRCFQLKLWDPEQNRMVGYPEA